MPKSLVIIPTLNENDNIGILIKRIVKHYPQLHILIVDGYSRDGTIASVKALQEKHPQLLLRVQDKGSDFGDAIALGFRIALEGGYDPILTMDGDLSHDPMQIIYFLKLQDKYDLILGSRYINGVRVEGWQFRKLLFSKLANMYISYILIRPIWDFTSGFRLYRKCFLEKIDLNKLEKQAYLLQVQLLYLAYKFKFRVKEIPIFFRDRYPGKSKILQESMFKTIFKVLKYRAPILAIMKHLNYVKGDYHRFVKEYEELVNPPMLKDKSGLNNMDKFSISIGIMAHNEEHWIESCINALRNQNITSGEVEEIFVISSGSTDRTNEIVLNITQSDYRVKLVEQTSRLGKANAINEFLSRAKGDIVVLSSADVIADPYTIEKLIYPIKDNTIGMSGCHPIPINKPNSLIGFFVNKLWQLHHLMALDNPKCGEMVAFRNIIEKIPNFTAVDEAVIESIFQRLHYKIVYIPDATAKNKGPETIKDFLKQRKRIASGHLHLKSTIGYTVSTYNSAKIFKYIFKSQKWNLVDIVRMIILIFVEGYSRLAGKLSFNIKDKNPFIWDISVSTKRL